jgi:tetratricopeptide (TPR) repeat protein
MNPRSSIRRTMILCLALAAGAGHLALPTTASAAKTLASEALAAAVANDTLDQVSQEVMMDAFQERRFEIDEAGIETLGRQLVAAGDTDNGVRILQLNQGLHHTSPRAAVALADAYRAAGDDIQASVFYDMALRMDPDNEAALRGRAETGSAEEMAMGAMAGMSDWEVDPEAMQEFMAQMGEEISPEKIEEMQQAMELMQQYQESGEMPQELKEASEQSRRAAPEATAEAKYESEQCEVLHRFNSHKRVLDAGLRASVSGHYQEPDRDNWTWNIESYCGDFLVAVPLWADVGPPVLEAKGGTRFEDSNGATWAFTMGSDGKPTSVTRTDADGTSTTLQRLGEPKKY